MGELAVQGSSRRPRSMSVSAADLHKGETIFDEATMIDFGTAKTLSHRRNIQRCVTLLVTELTELERQYLHKRIAEERAELERLQGTTWDAGVQADNRA
jgi:hypothetical protein